MAIFSKRTIARLLDDLAALLPPDKQSELRGSLDSASDGDGPISAEWELAVLNSLRTAGTLSFPETTGRQTDLIFTSAATNERAMVEITAISDKGLREKNPIDDFSRQLGKINSKLRPIVGTLDYLVGNTIVDGEVVLGVPNRSELSAFFKCAPFRDFLTRIRNAPSRPHRYDFECRGSKGSISFRPGARYGSGGHASFNQINDLRKNHITTRLRKKDQQLRDAKLDLPGIVVLCDGDCASLKGGMAGLGKPRLEEVIDVFLNGRPHQQAGQLVLQRGVPAATRRINAIIVIAAKENIRFLAAGTDRFFEVRYGFNRSDVYQPLSNASLELMCDSLQKTLPVIRTSPLNARRTYPYPRHYGGWELKPHVSGSMKMKISLLALQGLLNGTIKQEDFLRDHDQLKNYMLKALMDGRMISKLEIEQCADEDDDWVHIEFGAIHPDRLFSAPSKKD